MKSISDGETAAVGEAYLEGTTSFHSVHSPLPVMSAKVFSEELKEAPHELRRVSHPMIASFFLTSQTMTVLSALAVQRYLPFGDQRMREIASV